MLLKTNTSLSKYQSYAAAKVGKTTKDAAIQINYCTETAP